MKYNRTYEENINNVVTGMRWRDIKDIFKRNADNETKRIHFGSNYYQCRINSNGICIGAKDICNPEMLDLTEVKEYIQNATTSIYNASGLLEANVKEYIQNATTSIYNASGLLEANNVKTLNKRLDHIKEELYKCYERIDEIEESSYINKKKNIKDKEIEEIER